MPRFAVLAAAAHVCRDVNDSLLEQSDSQGAKAGIRRNVKAAVSIEHGRIIAVERDPFLVRDEDGHVRAVFAGNEGLFSFEVSRVEAGNIYAAKL